MGESISDQELRRRLSTFNTVVPPVTNTTRRLLLKKLEDLENNQSSQIDLPKTNFHLMNVPSWNNSASEDEDQNSYLSTDTKHFSSNVRISPREPVIRSLRTNPITETPYADKAIQRWKEKMMNQSQNKIDSSPNVHFPTAISSVYSQNSRKYVQPTQQRHLVNGYTRNTQYIILLFIGFFIVIFGLYFTSIQSSTVVFPSGMLNSLCAKKNLQGTDCSKEQENVQRLYNSLVSQVQDKYIKQQCDNSDIDPTIDKQTVFEYFMINENTPSREIEELVELFKSIAKTYSDSPIGFDKSFYVNVQPNLPILCAIKHIFANMFYIVVWLGIVATSVVSIYFGVCYIATKSEKNKQEVNQLVENTIDLLKQHAQYRPNESYLPIIHIRDQLIPPNERSKKSKIWAEVEQYFIDSESRVRSEVQQIDGEDYQVWRWVQPMSPNIAKKVWQGQAFETNEGSMNSPQPSPTSCLKVRHMFGPDSMIGLDCETHIKNAILEKCESIEVLHLSVDRNSQDGCVYVKCASPTEAGKAYRQLHGFWFDGKLVTVKFLRLERYHQRFPDAVNTAIPLRPSNNEKRSLK